jgi:hypothetical protein
MRTLAEHRRLWVATFEIYPQIEQSEQLRDQIAAAGEAGRRALAALLLDIPEEQVGEQAIRTLGSLLLALISGLVTQWLLDPQRAPSADDVIFAIRMTLSSNRMAG